MKKPPKSEGVPSWHLKYDLKMKLSLLFFLTISFLIQANSSYAQKTKISMERENSTVKEILDEIETTTEFKFLFNTKDVDLQRKLSIKVDQASIKRVLALIFKDVDTSYELDDRKILLKKTSEKVRNKDEAKISVNENPQQTISGTVTDTEGRPLPGANIIEKGTTNGVTADFDGNFSIVLNDENATLQISYIGFASKDVAINGQTTVNVTLKESAAGLDEVVVIGYGTARKSDLTGAVASADLSTATETSNVSVVQALQGSIAGLNVGAVTSAGQNPSLSIRGQSTLSSAGGDNQPLIVLDGIIYRGSIVDINSADIASIEVLKDASSAAIYGSQASNGVIVITSKNGSVSSKPIFNFSSSYTVQTPSNKFEPMNAAELEEFYPDIWWARGSRLSPDFLEVDPDYVWQNNFKTNEINQGYADGLDTPWFDLLTNDGSIASHNLSVQGKSDSLGYFLSMGLTDQEGFIKGDDYQRYNFRANIDAKINDWLTIGTQTFVTVSDYSGQSANYNNQNAYFYLQPWAPIRDEAGEFVPNPEGSWLNPFLALEVDDSDIRFNLSSVIFADIKLPIDGLNYRANYANNYRRRDQARFDPSAASFQGTAFKDHSVNWDYTFDNILNYRKTFQDAHNINATLVYGIEKRHISGTRAASRNFSVDILGFNDLSAGDPTLNTVNSSKEEESSLYQMGRLLYNFKNRYFFTGTVRRDGFSGFGENEKIGVFPSVALGWTITEESFADSSSWLNYLKLRASYGQSGRRGLGRYDTRAQVQAEPSVVFGDGGQTFLGQEVASLSNPALTWETTTGTNLAVDFGLFNSRLQGSIDYYQNKTENILFTIDLPQITGFENVNTNLAEVSNNGIEITLDANIVNTGSWRWDTSFSFNRVRNKIESIIGDDNDGDGVEDDLITNNTSGSLFIGEPQNVYYDYEIVGMWQLEDEANGTLWEGFLPGTYRLNDLNDDGQISSLDDRKILGYRDPSYRFGVGNTISYNDFSLFVFVNSIQGGKEYYWGNDTPHSQGSFEKSDQLGYHNIPKGAWDYWMPENPNARYRRLDQRSQFGGAPITQRSFVRLQDVTFNYNFPDKITEKINLDKLSLFISGKNLATWTDWRGGDPETGVGFMPTSPLLKTYTLGLNVQF
ncbi:TonB-linked outer membrane protein, SusC/RagA family [Zobellia uliginosa]|uniref:TonB-linked outer membrane protein, SusC/RagA family n=1 Tax=Zobellia uliginosa TaxID=143224 RepID=A0ABY1L1Y5_9FLAO|nr:TonB-dependent receptor [Zobellia uliginosa]SIT13800.1 TonB-linked outer membrane protein, SusC/RagA family [Zobellia uliginosa]